MKINEQANVISTKVGTMNIWSYFVLFFFEFQMRNSKVNCGFLYPSCLQANITWNTSRILDTIANVETPEECQVLCTGDCAAFTWADPASSVFKNLCALFSSTEKEISCENCISGPAYCKCTMIGECSVDNENILGSYVNIPNEASCHQICREIEDCKFFTYFSKR